MDPNNSQIPGEGENLQKLEQDLQNLTQDKSGQTASPQIPVNMAPPLTPEPQIPDQELVQLPPQEPKSGSPVVTIAIILGAIAILAIVAYAVGTIFTSKNVGQKACTMEAKICPDGSSVSRTGPNCEFEACPTFAPLATEIPSGTASPSATPTITPKGTSTPTSSPSATPITY